MRDEATTIVAAIAEQAGAALFCETFPTRMERGAGRVNVPRIPYLAEHAVGVLGEFEQFIIVCSQTPAAFFAYPDLPSLLVPESAEVHVAIERDQNVVKGLQRLAEFCGVKKTATHTASAKLRGAAERRIDGRCDWRCDERINARKQHYL